MSTTPPRTAPRPSTPLTRSMVMSTLALSLSAATLGLAVNSRISQARIEQSAEDRAYERIVREVWTIAQPMYQDLDIAQPRQDPETLTDALHPLLAAAHASVRASPQETPGAAPNHDAGK